MPDPKPMSSVLAQLEAPSSPIRSSGAAPRERRDVRELDTRGAAQLAQLAIQPGSVVLRLCEPRVRCLACPEGTAPHDVTHEVYALHHGRVAVQATCFRQLGAVLEAAGVRP